MELVRGSAGRDTQWPGRWRTVGGRERYQGDRVITRMADSACNGKTRGRKDVVRFLMWASGENNGTVHGDGCWERQVGEGRHSLIM